MKPQDRSFITITDPEKKSGKMAFSMYLTQDAVDCFGFDTSSGECRVHLFRESGEPRLRFVKHDRGRSMGKDRRVYRISLPMLDFAPKVLSGEEKVKKFKVDFEPIDDGILITVPSEWIADVNAPYAAPLFKKSKDKKEFSGDVLKDREKLVSDIQRFLEKYPEYGFTVREDGSVHFGVTVPKDFVLIP